MRRSVATLTLLLFAVPTAAQEGVSSLLVEEVHVLAHDPAAVDSLWQELVRRHEVPFAADTAAVFLFRGEAETVAVAGDHTGWQPSAPLARVDGADVWWRVDAFPGDARIDYKLVVDGDWILDPANPHIQVSGFGPNSELRMPGWRPSPYTTRRADVPPGSLSNGVTIPSEHLSHPITIYVYAPANTAAETALPVVYFTDGHEYADDSMGAALIALDNLISEGVIEPTIAVFVDPRYGDQNLREELYLGDPVFAAFMADELVPWVDLHLPTRPDRDDRVLVGTSFGGLFAAYAGATRSDVFGKLVIQSPAFWPGAASDWTADGSVFDLVAAIPPNTLQVFMSAGTINDGAEQARVMHQVLLASDQQVTYRELNEGHSWGQWRAVLPEALRALLAAP